MKNGVLLHLTSHSVIEINWNFGGLCCVYFEDGRVWDFPLMMDAERSSEISITF